MNPENLKRYRATTYLTSAHRLSQLPDDEGVEIAFAGRSNAGKSSAINILCDQNNLARVSRTPGRTQMINLFEVASGKRIIDLPGYGYAKVPEQLRLHWQSTLQRFFEIRQALKGLVVIVDARRQLVNSDIVMLGWAQSRCLLTHILLTKADKLKRGASMDALRNTQQVLKRQKNNASVQLFSSKSKLGTEETYTALNKMFGF